MTQLLFSCSIHIIRSVKLLTMTKKSELYSVISKLSIGSGIRDYFINYVKQVALVKF